MVDGGYQSNYRVDLLVSLIDFFRYYSRDFTYNTGVASIRAGLLKKESKGWQNDVSTWVDASCGTMIK